MFQALTGGNEVEFSLDGGLSVIETDMTAPFSYSATIPESSSLQVWAKAMNTITGCSGTWDSSAIANAWSIPLIEQIQTSHAGVFPQGYVDVVCQGTQNSLYFVNGDPSATYHWSVAELVSEESNTMSLEIDWNYEGGDYTLQLEKFSSKGCSSGRDTLVLVSQPKPDMDDTVTLCEGDVYTYDLTGQFITYRWHDLSTMPTYTATTAEEVYVTVRDIYNCEGADTSQVLWFANPTVYLGADTTLCGANALLLDAGDFGDYRWTTGATTNPITVFEGSGIVGVTVTDEHGCEGYDEITIGNCSPSSLLVIPNTFTPNGDGVHDKWIIDNLSYFPDADIQVFDRWGRRVYQADGGSAIPWDGTGPNGNDLPVETYYYVIDLKIDGMGLLTGTVTILR
jgi:gliding motility-associated-like protein